MNVKDTFGLEASDSKIIKQDKHILLKKLSLFVTYLYLSIIYAPFESNCNNK